MYNAAAGGTRVSELLLRVSVEVGLHEPSGRPGLTKRRALETKKAGPRIRMQRLGVEVSNFVCKRKQALAPLIF